MHPVRRATATDAELVGRLFAEFNAEFGIDDPPAVDVARRFEHQQAEGEVEALLAGEDGFAQVRFRLSLYDDGQVCCLEELWVRPAARGRGLGSALLLAVVDLAREHGATVLDLNTSTDDAAARRLYERHGFTNLENGVPTASMLYYEREV